MRIRLIAPFAVVLCMSSPVAFAQDAAAIETLAAHTTAPLPTGDGQPPPITRVPPSRPHAAPALPTVSSLVGALPGRVAHVARAENIGLLLAAGASAALVHPHDARLTQHMATSPTLTRIFGPGEIVGGFGVQFGGAVATYAIARLAGHGRGTQLGADLVRAQVVAQGLTQALKLSINRQRPDGDNWSLPSGHSSGTFASATVLQRHYGWKAGVPAYAVAAYVAGSRLAERRHFASDVILGAGIGIVAGRAVTIGRGPTRFAMTPMAIPGRGVGVGFTRVAN